MVEQNILEEKINLYYTNIVQKLEEIIAIHKNLNQDHLDLKQNLVILEEKILAKLAQLQTPEKSPSPKKTVFDVKILNAFIKSTKEIIKVNTRQEALFLKPIADTKEPLPIIAASKMELSKDKSKGSVAFCLQQESAEQITKAIFMLPTDGKITPLDIKDVSSELCNQICGKSKLTLRKEGYSFEISLPEIHQGKSDEILTVLGTPKIALHFEFKGKPFYLFFWE
jgi:CheY-specific phosphatase CheX